MDKNKKQPPLFFTAVKLCFLILAGTGMTMMLAEFAGAGGVLIKLLLLLIISAVTSTVILHFVRRMPAGIFLICMIWASVVWLNRETVFGGFEVFINEASAMAEAYFNNEIMAPVILSGESLKQTTAFLMMVLTAWQSLAAMVNWKKNRPAVTALIPVILIGSGLAIGYVPSAEGLFWCGVGLVGLISSKVSGDQNYRAAAKSGLISAVLLAAISAVVIWMMPAEGYLKEEDRKEIRTAVRDGYAGFGEYVNEKISEYKDTGMGIGEGKLDEAGNLEYTGSVVLNVMTNRPVYATVYLKAYAAGDFRSNRWQPLDASGLDQVREIYDDNNSDYLKSIWNNTYMTMADDMESMMTILPSGASKSHLYIPYASLLDSGDKMAAEGYMTGLAGGQKRKISYAVKFFQMMSDPDSYMGLGPGGGRLESYSSYVQENYLSVEGMSEQFKNDYKIADGSSPGTVTEYIKEKFRGENIRYTLEPGRMPPRENIIDYFLYENKQGYCMHFASAAVMIYRLNGIPARYAEGYIVPRGSFSQRSSGYDEGGSPEFASDVRDYQAHAWPEIYINHFGWVPVEVTPAYTDGGIPEELTENTTEMSETETESDSAASEESESVPNDSAETEGTEKESIPVSGQTGGSQGVDGSAGYTGRTEAFDRSVLKVIFMIFASAVSALVLIRAQKYKMRRAEALLKPPYMDRTAKALWQYTMRWLILSGISSAKKGDVRQIRAQISDLKDADQINYLLDKLLEALYSKNGLDRETYSQVISVYGQFAEDIYGQLGLWQKFTARFVWCLPEKIG